MRQLFTIDKKDYDPNSIPYYRPSVRGIIIREGRVAMIHSLKYDYYKFPGGGIEPGETHRQALCREVAEEAGLTVLEDSIREYGLVHRVSYGKETGLFIQDNYYYLCQAAEEQGLQHLDDYEAMERFTLEFVSARDAIETNRYHDHGGKWGVVTERECKVLELLLREGFFG